MISPRLLQVLRLGSSHYVADSYNALLGLLEAVEEVERAGRKPPPRVAVMAQLAREMVEEVELSMGDETDEERLVREYENED